MAVGIMVGVTDARGGTQESRLARAGFLRPKAAVRELASPVLGALPTSDEFFAALAAAPDPDDALRSLVRVMEAADDAPDLAANLVSDERLRARLISVLGFSRALADHLVRHPSHWYDLVDLDATVRPDSVSLRSRMLSAVHADPRDRMPQAYGELADLHDALRVAYRRHIMVLAALDLADGLDVESVAAELADLAGATLEAGLAIARCELPPNAPSFRLAVVGMGKCGGHELNYVSDVDVVFVAEPTDLSDTDAALESAKALATGLTRAVSTHTAEGTIWPLDAGLRPEGALGPLVRTLDSYLAYYKGWAKTWEFQALLKARPVAGDLDLGAAFVAAVDPLVWSAAGRDGFVSDVQHMRQRVVSHVRPAEVERQLKLGPGGLRDVEFAVQLLQLVHGRMDDDLHSKTTLPALEALTAGGYVGRDDGAKLDASYRFLRTLEHRIQLRRLRRTHALPADEGELRILARSLDMRLADELVAEWRKNGREVRRLHEKLFYRPLLSAVADLPGEHARLSADAALARLRALGYVDPSGALRHIEALTRGVSRRAAIQRTLLPVLLGWFADGPEPDTGLAGFRKVSEALGATPWYLRLLRDDGVAAERLSRVLASGRYATELLLRAPEAVGTLAADDELRPRPREPLEAEVLAGVSRHDDPTVAIGVVRAMRRRELFRVAAADLLGVINVEDVGEALTAIAEACLAGALETAVRSVAQRRLVPTRFAVVAMGRLGGREMGFGSDADVVFVHSPLPGAAEEDATEAAAAVADEMRQLLSQPSPEPPLTLDTGLRPEGKQGPVVRTLPSYAAYYERWGQVWERQALLRAAPCCGDPELLRRFAALIEPLRWPSNGLTYDQVREIRRIKARVEAERLPRGADPAMNLKLGPGGLSDVEWCVQLIQLRHAARHPSLQTPSTMAALDAAVAAKLLNDHDAAALRSAWRIALRMRNATVLVSGRASDEIPKDPQTLASVSRVMGYAPGESAKTVDDYHRAARQARTVVERVFYDERSR